MWALIQNLNSDYPAACNNATWALGEVAMHLGEEKIAFIPIE
jgi:transportin-1